MELQYSFGFQENPLRVILSLEFRECNGLMMSLWINAHYALAKYNATARSIPARVTRTGRPSYSEMDFTIRKMSIG